MLILGWPGAFGSIRMMSGARHAPLADKPDTHPAKLPDSSNPSRKSSLETINVLLPGAFLDGDVGVMPVMKIPIRV